MRMIFSVLLVNMSIMRTSLFVAHVQMPIISSGRQQRKMIGFEFNVEDCAEDETYYKICSLIQLVYHFDETRHSNSIFMDDIDEKLNELSDGQIRVRYWVVNEKLHCTPIYHDIELRDKYENQGEIFEV